jgi:hypothetical protein
MKRSREPDNITDADAEGPTLLSSSDPETSSLPAAKIVELDIPSSAAKNVTMKCSLPPHKEGLSFQSYQEYEAHYNGAHLNRCLECHKNFPSEHLLNLHFEECHDPFAEVKRERGEQTVSGPCHPQPPANSAIF